MTANRRSIRSGGALQGATASFSQAEASAAARSRGYPFAVTLNFLNSSDVKRLVAEQQPDANAPCPHCGKPVNESANIFVEANETRLLAHCGGSGDKYSGQGCFATVAWNPDERTWEPY